MPLFSADVEARVPIKVTLIRRVPIERPGAANSLAGGEKCNVIEHMQGVAYLRLLRHVTF